MYKLQQWRKNQQKFKKLLFKEANTVQYVRHALQLRCVIIPEASIMVYGIQSLTDSKYWYYLN